MYLLYRSLKKGALKSGTLLRGEKQFDIALDVRASLHSGCLDAMMVRTATVSGIPPSTKYYLFLTTSTRTVYADYI